MYLPSGENEGEVSIEGWLVIFSTILFSRSMVYISELPSFAKLMIIFFPFGENLGANVIPGKSPTTSCIPVSISKR